MADVIVAGSFVQDLAFSTPRFPEPGETRIGRFAAGPGGKGFNQAVACNRQKVDTLFVGAVGNDAFAETARAFAEKEGLSTRLESHSDLSTGAASIVVNEEAENLIVVALGANDALSVSSVDACRDAFGDSKVVLCQLEANLDAMRRALALGRESGAATILNPAPINEDVTKDLLEQADILTPNETEFAFLLKKFHDIDLSGRYWAEGGESMHALCRKLSSRAVIVTLGDEGCFVSCPKASAREAYTISGDAYYFESPISVNPIDTAGAGDAFSGGLAAGLARCEGDLTAAVKFASVVGGLSTEKAGTAPAMPTAEEVEARI